NGDGRLDLAVVSHDGNVSVFSGNGDGTLQAPVNYAAGSQPSFVAAGDFNGDGHPDLAVANSFSQGTVSVLLNTCGGCPAFDFTLPQAFDVGSSPFSVAVGDFNSDGKRDLVVANSGSTNVSVLLGNGDGTFQAALNFSAGPRPYWVASGDFNGDGKPDLAVADSGSTNVSVLLGNGNGTFQAAVNYGTGVHPWSVAAGDFNNDGKTDLAVANAGSVGLSILLGNGDGTFQTAVSYPAGMGSVALAVSDFNDDGKLDLAVGNISSSNVSVLLGNGDGTFQAAINFGNQLHPQSVAVGDFNADGKPDLALADFTPTGISGTVSVLLNTCAFAGIELTIVRSNSNTVTVSWPFPSTGFVLESTTNLTLMNCQ